jgi:hypothetical protein
MSDDIAMFTLVRFARKFGTRVLKHYPVHDVCSLLALRLRQARLPRTRLLQGAHEASLLDAAPLRYMASLQ